MDRGVGAPVFVRIWAACWTVYLRKLTPWILFGEVSVAGEAEFFLKAKASEPGTYARLAVRPPSRKWRWTGSPDRPQTACADTLGPRAETAAIHLQQRPKSKSTGPRSRRSSRPPKSRRSSFAGGRPPCCESLPSVGVRSTVCAGFPCEHRLERALTDWPRLQRPSIRHPRTVMGSQWIKRPMQRSTMSGCACRNGLCTLRPRASPAPTSP